MDRIISDSFLAHICPYRFSRFDEDSHARMKDYCAMPPQNYGNEPECQFQCTEKLGGNDTEGGTPS